MSWVSCGSESIYSDDPKSRKAFPDWWASKHDNSKSHNSQHWPHWLGILEIKAPLFGWPSGIMLLILAPCRNKYSIGHDSYHITEYPCIKRY